jgi:hypothetical protein
VSVCVAVRRADGVHGVHGHSWLPAFVAVAYTLGHSMFQLNKLTAFRLRLSRDFARRETRADVRPAVKHKDL